MMVKSFVFVLTLSTLSLAQANLCDDMKDNGAAPEQIQRCLDKFGVSAQAREKEESDQQMALSEQEKKERDAKIQGNLEEKKFTENELFDAGFGQPFIAFTITPDPYKPEEKRITKGDSLCAYLGYEKVKRSTVSSDIPPENSDKKGLIVDTTLGFTHKEPDLYQDKGKGLFTRKYVDITCVRRKNKLLEDSDEPYRKLIEQVETLPQVVNVVKKDSNTKVNDENRKVKSTPNGYKRPAWADDAPASSTTSK